MSQLEIVIAYRWSLRRVLTASAFAFRELVAQRLVIRFELHHTGTYPRQRRVDLRLGKTLSNVLLAIPVEGVEVEQQHALRLRLVAGRRHRGGQVRIVVKSLDLDMGEDLQPPAVRIIHQ